MLCNGKYLESVIFNFVRYFLNWDFLFEFCYWNHYLNSMTINQQIDDSFVVFQFFDSHVWLLNNSFLMIVLFTKSFSPLFTQNQTKVWSLLLRIVQMEVWFHSLLKLIWHIGLLGARNSYIGIMQRFKPKYI